MTPKWYVDLGTIRQISVLRWHISGWGWGRSGVKMPQEVFANIPYPFAFLVACVGIFRVSISAIFLGLRFYKRRLVQHTNTQTSKTKFQAQISAVFLRKTLFRGHKPNAAFACWEVTEKMPSLTFCFVGCTRMTSSISCERKKKRWWFNLGTQFSSSDNQSLSPFRQKDTLSKDCLSTHRCVTDMDSTGWWHRGGKHNGRHGHSSPISDRIKSGFCFFYSCALLTLSYVTM